MENNESLKALSAISEAALVLTQAHGREALTVLMDLEDVLDKGRVLVSPRKTELEEELFRKMVANMDELRGVIRTIIDTSKRDEMMEFMKERGRTMMNQFFIQ